MLSLYIYIFDYNHITFTLITSLHITHTRILSSTAFRFESSIRVICKNILKRSKIEREIFLKFERNDDFENIVCLSYLGCSSSFLTVQYLCISVFLSGTGNYKWLQYTRVHSYTCALPRQLVCKNQTKAQKSKTRSNPR